MGDMHDGVAGSTFHRMDDCYAVNAQTKTRKSGEEGQLHFAYLMFALHVLAGHLAHDGRQTLGGEYHPNSQTYHQQYDSYHTAQCNAKYLQCFFHTLTSHLSPLTSHLKYHHFVEVVRFSVIVFVLQFAGGQL